MPPQPIQYKNSLSTIKLHPQNHQATGFTLIELVVVIVILGILAATALPKFVNFRQDALITTSQGIRGALMSAASLTHAKAAIEGKTSSATDTISINGQTIDLVYGYPAGTAGGIVKMVDTPAGDWNQRASTYTGAWVYWHGAFGSLDAGTQVQCYVRYRQPTAANQAPVIDIVTSGCK